MEVEEVRQEARQFSSDANPSHDWFHVERVEELAERISPAEADEEVLKLLVFLHDIGRAAEDRGEVEDHTDFTLEKSEEVLREHGFRQEVIEDVKHCIKAHRYSREEEPESLEAKILSDADNLDSIGAISIARTFSVCGERGNLLADPDLPAEEDSSESGENGLNHLKKKILNLRQEFYTEKAREFTEERHRFVENYVERLEEEILGEA